MKFKDRFANPQGSGYRDLQMNVRMEPNNHIAEFRLHLKSLDAVSEYEHALYEVRRDIDSLAVDEGRVRKNEKGENEAVLSPEENALAVALLRREQELFWKALQTGLPKNLRRSTDGAE